MKKPKISIGVLLIFAIFMNPIIVGGLDTICYLLIYGIALFYILIHINYIFNNYLRQINIKIAIPMVWVFIALILSLIVPSLHGTGDYSYVNVVLGIFRKAIILVFLFLITARKSEKETVIENFMYYYASASVLYVFSTMIFTLIPSSRSIWQNIIQISNTALHILNSYGYTNRFGWAGFAGFRNTIDCTISLIFLIYLFASEKSKFNIKVGAFVFLSFMCFLGNMFYGRSGVVSSTLCLIIGLTLYKKIRPKVLFTIFGMVIIGILLINMLRNRIPAVNEWYTWVSTPFYNLITTGAFNNYSANRLLNEMIFMPSGNTLLFGDGRYVDAATGSYYMRTDSGFMRQILFWGLGATLLTYLCWLHSLMIIRRDLTFKFMLFVMCVLFEIKGELYYEMIPFFLIMAMIDMRMYKVSEIKVNKSVSDHGSISLT